MVKRTAAILVSLALLAVAPPALADQAATLAATTPVAGAQEPVQTLDVEKVARLAEEMIRAAQVEHVGFAKTASGDGVEITLNRKFIKKLSSSYIREVDLARKVSFEVIQNPGGNIQIHNIKGITLKEKHHIKITELSFTINHEGVHIANISGKRLGITRTVTANLSGRLYSVVSTVAGQLKARTVEAQKALAKPMQPIKTVGKPPANTADANVSKTQNDGTVQPPETAVKDSSSPSASKPANGTPTLGDVLNQEASSPSQPSPDTAPAN